MKRGDWMNPRYDSMAPRATGWTAMLERVREGSLRASLARARYSGLSRRISDWALGSRRSVDRDAGPRE